MPPTEVVFFRDERGRVPVLEWLDQLQRRDKKAAEKCWARIRRLAAVGHELRRPTGAHIGQGLYELRLDEKSVNYRVLYFFHGQNVAVLVHALTKETKVPAADVERALGRRTTFGAAPRKHIHEELIDG